MKKILLAVFAVTMLAVPAMAGIKDTKHNLSSTGDYAYRSTNEVQVCVFCHTPHNAVPNIPLWNRTNPTAGTFQLYTSSLTLNIGTTDKGALASDSISLFCLSCHDGSVALNAIRNFGNAGATPTMRNGKTNLGVAGAASKAALGTNLTNDHPINFSYDDAQSRDTTLRASASITGIKWFKSSKTANTNYLECASCHEVHGAGFRKFLRKSNDSSSLCLTCHNK